MTFITARRTAATIATAMCMAIPATAQAQSDAAQLPGARSADQATSTFPPAGYRGGDSPIDHPGASRAQPAPTTVEVVRPERTIVRNVDEALPIALSSAALLLVLVLFGVTLARARLVPRPDRST
jgi:hypothetical protein